VWVIKPGCGVGRKKMLGSALREKMAQRSKRSRAAATMRQRQKSRLMINRIQARGGPGGGYSSAGFERMKEKKGMDTPFSVVIDNDYNNNQGTQCLNLIQAGSGSWNRIGRKSFPKSIRLTYALTWTFANSVSKLIPNILVRTVLVWDKSPQKGTLPKFNEVFSSTLQDGTETAYFQSGVAFDAMDRFTIIRDKTHTLNPQSYPPDDTAPDSSRITVCEDDYIRMPAGLETVYASNSTPMTIADVYSGALYLMTYSYYGVPAGCAIFYESSSVARLRYSD